MKVTQVSDRSRRIVGARYGLLLGPTYALTAGTIDRFLVRDVPLRLDWPGIAASVMITGLLGWAWACSGSGPSRLSRG